MSAFWMWVGRPCCSSLESKRNEWNIRWIINVPLHRMSQCRCPVGALWHFLHPTGKVHQISLIHVCVCIIAGGPHQRPSARCFDSSLLWSVALDASSCLSVHIGAIFLSFCSILSYLATKSLPERFGLFWCIVYSWLMLRVSLNKTTTSWH